MNKPLRVLVKTLPQEIIINENQRLVLEQLLNGESYKSISASLDISQAAVRQYAHRLYKKLKVSNRMEAIIEYGLRSDNKSYHKNT